MSFLLRLCLGLAVLAPSLVYAQSNRGNLEIPSDGDNLSGIGVISGWKCEAGEITVQVDDTSPLPTLYGLSRGDTSEVCGDDGNNGFVTYLNWWLLADGEHTVKAFDNGVEFASNTVTVTRAGPEFLRDAPDRQVMVHDFPRPGETTTFEWNRTTQHLEVSDWLQPEDRGTCTDGLVLEMEQRCSGSVSVAGVDSTYTFTVDTNGRGCISVSIASVPINTCFEDSLPDILRDRGVDLGLTATKNDAGAWTLTIANEPAQIATCRMGLTVQRGSSCTGSLLGRSFTFSVNDSGQACIEGTNVVDGCFSTAGGLPALAQGAGVRVTKNTDNSWTITNLPA